MGVTCSGFEVETLINVRIAKHKLRVVEVPSTEHERLFGESKLKSVRDGCRVLRTIVHERCRRPAIVYDWRPGYREIALGQGDRPRVAASV
jgi:hypothetical protein